MESESAGRDETNSRHKTRPMDKPNEAGAPRPRGPFHLDGFQGNVSLQNVVFGYRPDNIVHQGFSVEIVPARQSPLGDLPAPGNDHHESAHPFFMKFRAGAFFLMASISGNSQKGYSARNRPGAHGYFPFPPTLCWKTYDLAARRDR